MQPDPNAGAPLALSLRVIGRVTVGSLIVVLTSFFAVYLFGKGDWSKLAAQGELLGALFSACALVGLVASQILQYRSLVIQAQSLEAQMKALSANTDEVRLTNAALTTELLQHSIERAERAFSRLAKSLIVMDPSVDRDFLATLAEREDPSDLSWYPSQIMERSDLLETVKTGARGGLSAVVAQSYVDLYNELSRRSAELSKATNTMDLFQLTFRNSSANQLHAALEAALKD